MTPARTIHSIIVQSEPEREEPLGDGSGGGDGTIFALRGCDPGRAGDGGCGGRGRELGSWARARDM